MSLRLKRRLFDQVMLTRRMEEEKVIIVKEITQHYQYLTKALDKLDNLLHHTEEDIKNHSMFYKSSICRRGSIPSDSHFLSNPDSLFNHKSSELFVFYTKKMHSHRVVHSNFIMFPTSLFIKICLLLNVILLHFSLKLLLQT